MLALVLSMLVIVTLAAGVVTYVAYPHRGRELPVAPRVGAALRRGVERLPTLRGDDGAAPSGPALQPHAGRGRVGAAADRRRP